MTLEEYLSTGPPHERAVAEAVIAHVEGLGDVHVEPVSVGIFFKGTRTFAQLRPLDRWCALSFSLRRVERHPAIVRKVIAYGARYHHVANLRRPEDYDERLRDWVTEAYLDQGP